MMLQVTWQLMHLCIIAIATVIPGSSGFSEPLSLESSSPIPAIEAQVPHPVLARGPLLNGPTIQPPIVSPSIKAPPRHQTIQGPLPFLSPRESTTLPPQHDLTTSNPTQSPYDLAPPLSAEPTYNPDFPAARAPQDATPAPVAGLSHGLPPPASTVEPPYYSTQPPSAGTSTDSTSTPSAGSPHASALPPAAKPLVPVPQLPNAKSPETQPPVAKPPHSFALPLASKPPESKPPLPAAEPPKDLTLTPPIEAPPNLPLLPPATPPHPSGMSSSPAPQTASASPPQPVSSYAPPPTSTVPSNLLPPSIAPPTTLPSPSSPLPPNVFSPPPQVPPTVSSPPAQLNPPIISSPPPQPVPPTVSSPPPQLVPPTVSSPPPQLVPPTVSSPPPQLVPPTVSSPPPQLVPPTVSSPPPQLVPPTVSSPPPQLVPPTVSSPPPQLVPPIVSSPPPQLNPSMASSPPPQLNPPMVSSPPPQLNPPIVSSPPQSNPPMVSSPSPQLNPPMESSPPPQLNPPMESSPPPQLNPPMESSPPPQLNPPMVSSPLPQLNPPAVSSPPPEMNPPVVSSPPPELNPPMESSPPELNPPMVSSPPPQLNPPMVSSPPTQLNPPMVSSPPPQMIPSVEFSPPPQQNPPTISSPPPVISSPLPQLVPPIAPSPKTKLIPPPASLPNPAVPSNASVPPPFIVSPPNLSSPPIVVPPRASAIVSPPLPSHALSPMPQLSPRHVSPAPPPSKLPLTPHSSVVPGSVPPHPSPTPPPISPVFPSRPYAPPPSGPSHSSVPPSPVMKQFVPAAPPKASQRKEPQEGASPPSITSPEPSPPSRPLPDAAPPADQVTPRSHPPSSHQIQAPKHSPFLKSNASEPDNPPSSTPPPSNNPVSGRYPLLAPPSRAPYQSPGDELSPYHAPSKPKVERYNSTAPAPFSFRVHPASNGSHHFLRHSPVKGSPPATTPLPSPPEIPEISSAPSPLSRAPPGHSGTPFLSPKISPSRSSTRNTKRPLAPPTRSLPPPPPNADCAYLTCPEPFTNTPPGSPCGCVWPMQVGLRLSVALYTFFPLVSELSKEIAAGVFMKQSQVRVMGANAASEQSEKTIALVDLVPLSEKFDNVTSYLTFQRFWHKQVVINKSVFGDYDVLYVRYPGLPPSPPMAPADMAVINGMPYSVRDPNQSSLHPLGVDVTKQRHKHKLNGIAIVAIVFSAIVGVLVCCSVAWVLVFRYKNLDAQPTQTPRALPSLGRSSGPTGHSTGSGPSSPLSVESSLATYAGSAKTFSTRQIEKATDNLSPSRVIGEGGFGLVYGGVLEDETSVAIKVLKRDDQQGGREFLAEVEMLSRLHHRNLVKLIGICTDERLRCLVYELIPNGSVDSHLHGTDKEIAPLDWNSRMKIALGAARGLAYLHEDSSPRVIHRDFKSSNILLESDFTPKVSDFGLARSAMDGDNRHISTRVMGTFGYVAPEYAMTGHLLVKSDVYSYGVVLLELLTGRKPVDMSQPPGQENVVAWTRPFLTTKEGLELILDPSLGSDLPLDSVAKVAAIASMCVQPEVSHRPFMGEVVQALKLVCNECDDSKDGDSSLGSPESLSVDFEAKASPVSKAQDYLPVQLSLQKYFPTHDVEKGVSVSEKFSASAHVDRQTSDTFRRQSASGPLKTARGRHFWQRVGRQSDGSVSEHGIMYRLWAGSH